MTIDRGIYFQFVRASPFGGKLTQSQVDGQEAILGAYEADYGMWDLRWLAYALATTFHETSQEMQPIEEYGKGQGMEYGKPDSTTGQTYYGRGFVQLTWRDNYRRADQELDLDGELSCEWHADNALEPTIAAMIMFEGMSEGWFRKDENGVESLGRYFNDTTDDPYNAREIINGDKSKVPSWSTLSIGRLIEGYHNAFLSALSAGYIEVPYPPPPVSKIVVMDITVPEDTEVRITVNGITL